MAVRPTHRMLVFGDAMLQSALEKFQKRYLLRKLVGNASWQVADKLVRMIGSLVVGVWVARYLGPLDFGLLSFAAAFVALFTPIADLGMQAVVVRDLVRRPEDRAQIVSSALVVRVVSSSIAVGLVVAAICTLRADSPISRLVVLATAMSLLPQALDVIDYEFQARMNFQPIVMIRCVSFVIFSVVKIALILAGLAVVWFALMATAEMTLAAILMCVLAKREALAVRLRDVRWHEVRSLLHGCWPLAIAHLSVLLYMRIDQIMLGQMVDDQAVGIFSAAVRVSEVWFFVPLAVMNAAAPMLTAAHRSSSADYEHKLSALTRALSWTGMGVGLVFTVIADPMINVLLGAGYAEAANVLMIHAWTGVFACLGLAAAPWFVNAGMLKFRMVHTAIGAAVNVGLNLLLIPRFGAVGAAFSTLLSNSLAAFLLNSAHRHTWPLFRIQTRALLPLR